ncbi:hypothetical protein KR222_007921, partial [Zaprionus bogoriensis]
IAAPLYNGEAYPPVPLPAPPPSAETKLTENPTTGGVNCAPLLEAGSIVIRNTVQGSAVQETGLDPKNIVFDDQSIRKGFIRKVYFILLTQLLFTIGVMAIFVYNEPTKHFIQSQPVVLVTAIIVNIVVMLSMACCETARRSYPLNFVCLALFTVTMSLLLGGVASTLDADVVIFAVAVTAVLVVSLSIFAIQTKYDFTAWGGVALCVVIFLLILAVGGLFFRSTFAKVLHSSLGALLASFLLIYDTQLILGGTHKYQFNPEEYIFAALTLYVDVVRILLYVLRFVRYT